MSKDWFNSKKIIDLYCHNNNVFNIAKKYNVRLSELKKKIKDAKLNINTTTKYCVNDTFFDKIDTEEKAYLLGYFLADGCMYNEKVKKDDNGNIISRSYRMGIGVAADDFETIKLAQNAICPNKPIEYSFYQNGVKKRKPQNKIRWSSKHMFNTLLSYGIEPRKTYNPEFTLKKGIVPDKLFRHFIRGYFDGDGCKGDYNLRFCVNSRSFGEELVKFFPFTNRIDNVKGKTCEYYRVRVNGGKSLMDWTKKTFYNDSNCYLTRKYLSFNPVNEF